jgi:hypothetical protein
MKGSNNSVRQSWWHRWKDLWRWWITFLGHQLRLSTLGKKRDVHGTLAYDLQLQKHAFKRTMVSEMSRSKEAAVRE